MFTLPLLLLVESIEKARLKHSNYNFSYWFWFLQYKTVQSLQIIQMFSSSIVITFPVQTRN